MTAITVSHILLDERGRAYIDGTHTRVAMIVMDKTNGLSPEQIAASYPYLSLSQIHGALAFYYDHKAQLDAEIAVESAEASKLREQAIASSTSQPAHNSRNVWRIARSGRDPAIVCQSPRPRPDH